MTGVLLASLKDDAPSDHRESRKIDVNRAQFALVVPVAGTACARPPSYRGWRVVRGHWVGGLSAAAALLLSLIRTGSACAHNLDEYLQAAVISLHPDRIHISMRLVPGVAVLPELLKVLDTNADGRLSQAEQRAYTQRVIEDICLRVDGAPVALHARSATHPSIDAMREGRAEFRFELDGYVSARYGSRTLVFENRHLRGISVYLANSLVPAARQFAIIAQRRNQSQSVYELRYRQQASSDGG